MIVSLTGFMGCGKSSVGKELSRLLCCDFVDLDAEIEARCGRSVPEIFDSSGEEGFRREELEALRDVLRRPGSFVLSLGGGTVTIPQAAQLVHSGTVCFYLRAQASSLSRWLDEDGTENRPMLREHGVEQLLAGREPVYSATAHHIIDVDALSYEESARIIASILRLNP